MPPSNPNLAEEQDKKAPNQVNEEDEKQESEEDKKKKAEGWLSHEELVDVKIQIEAMIEYQKADGRWDKWCEHLDFLNCRWDSIYEDTDYDLQCNVNSIYANVQIEIPELYFQQPTVNVSAKTPFFKKQVPTQQGMIDVKINNIESAKLFGIRLNNVLENAHLEGTVERGIADALAPYGYAVFKVGYGLETEAGPDLEHPIEKTTYWVRRCDPRNVLFDVLAPSFRERTVTAERLHRKKSKLLKDDRYLKEVIGKLSTKIPETLKARIDKLGKKYDPKLVEFFEWHNEETKMVHWISIDGNPVEVRKPLKKKTWIEGSDFIVMSLNVETDDSIYPLSDVDPIIDQAKARNRIRTAEVDHFENWGITIFVESKFFKDEEQGEAWRKAGNKATIVRLPDGAISQNRMEVAQPPQMPRDWFQMEELHRRDNDETLGITAYEKGGTSVPADTTATEAGIISNSANKRTNRRRRRIKNAVLEISRKLGALVVQYDDNNEMLDVTGKVEDDNFTKFLSEQYKFNKDVPFLEVNKEMWQGEYLYDFQIEEMVERPKAVQIQQLLSTFAAAGQNPFLAQALMKITDPVVLATRLLELQGILPEELKNQQTELKLPPEIENEMAERGIDIPAPAPDEDFNVHIFTHLKLMKDMQARLPALLKGAATGDPEAVAAYTQVKRSMQILQRHVIATQQAEMKAEQMSQMTGMASAMPMNGPSMLDKILPPAPQGAPTDVNIMKNAGASFVG